MIETLKDKCPECGGELRVYLKQGCKVKKLNRDEPARSEVKIMKYYKIDCRECDFSRD